MGSGTAAYRDWFFDLQTRQSRASADLVVPHLLELSEARSVLDVGGGVGAWAAACGDHGVPDVLCVDGDYVDRARLLVAADRFHAHDLTRSLDLGRRYDMVVCLEVAEHLHADCADTLVDSLARHADLVAFSAAIPGQGGEHHVNEQWPSYWCARFAQRGYELFDVVRPRIWSEREVGFWFRQNLLLFARGAMAERLRTSPVVLAPLDLVHPETWARRNDEHRIPPTIRESALQLRSAVGRRIRRTGAT